MQKLTYWNTCINLEYDASFYDPTEFAQIDEEAVHVDAATFAALIYGNFQEFVENIEVYECAVYPSVDDIECGFIYDIEKDIHYIFVV